MATKSPHQMVVDASIARAAGPQESLSLDAKPCRDFLERLRKVSITVVLSKTLRNEWERNELSFAKRWRSSMKSRGLIKNIEIQENLDLRQAISQHAENQGAEQAMMKDCHLLEAALETDKRISSLDDKVKRHFHYLSRQFPMIHNILWINPKRDTDLALQWLNAGTKYDAALCLGFILDVD